ncbi:TetR/AcrR family transcriptional regulator [Shewanella cyperi]|uniref:TetR/AcrR family transcriptional regulator n=1 Tax=Shewanella cyperi TaxID=2814292 RepID=A0A975AM23_9GAMM|nr:TetR/AcrR family transcriptional regulator [Shewanella cyperi]QSX31396.1 TetR/AcrR family transcriptional regulator [Shewanella cyperi]
MQSGKPTRSELKRQAILDAARQAFQQQGVQGTSMDAIAALAQVSKRTVYNHFATKEALVLVLITEVWHRANADLGVKYRADAALKPQLLQMAKAQVELMSRPDYLELVRVGFGHFLFHPEGMREQMKNTDMTDNAIGRWLKAALADGRLKPMDVGEAMGQLSAMLKGAAFWPQLTRMREPLTKEEQHKVAEAAVDMFLNYYQV